METLEVMSHRYFSRRSCPSQYTIDAEVTLSVIRNRMGFGDI